jgi:hypothetical protein
MNLAKPKTGGFTFVFGRPLNKVYITISVKLIFIHIKTHVMKPIQLHKEDFLKQITHFATNRLK